ncbi:MAG TPA: efflux RND transporter periplasmic adaptor subunit [Candidatus Cybelea sp.]|nr:efflux RND transporter periplasmic adaptor subunit [Candidatus Cybelea sp.]
MTPLIRTLLVATVVVIAVLVGWRFLFHPPAPPATPAQPLIPLATVREGRVNQTIALVGRVGPPAGTQTKLAFPVPGSVARVDVALGEHVEKGAALAQLDPTSYALAAAQAQAESHAANAGAAVAGIDRTTVRLRVDEAELARKQRLFHAGVVALRDVQAAQGTVAADRAEAQTARLQVTQAQAQSRAAGLHAASTTYDVNRTTLRAPVAGVVVGIFVQPGQVVDPTTSAIAIASDRQGFATLDAPVAELSRVRVGDPAELRSNGMQWSGRVAGIASAVDPSTGLATLSVTGVPSDVAAGTPLDATVIVGAIRGLIVPQHAVIEDPQTGAELVFVAQRRRDGTLGFASRTVTIGARDEKFAQVRSGLTPGERVAAEGAIDLLAPSGGQ